MVRHFGATLALAAWSCAAPANAQDFYAGKQLTIIVGAGPGGGYDLQARIAARYLARHVPGNPTIIVQNIPSRIAAANMMFSTAMKDGTTIALLQRGILLAKLIYPSGVRFEIEKFHWLGSLNSETAVTLAWHTAPHKTAKDLFSQELIVGGITGVDPETTPRLYNSLIGTKFKVVTGYSSTAQIALAVERGEVQGIADGSWSGR
jgi:tripartite-type tricarboxylate transporter receptor subunit TctC